MNREYRSCLYIVGQQLTYSAETQNQTQRPVGVTLWKAMSGR